MKQVTRARVGGGAWCRKGGREGFREEVTMKVNNEELSVGGFGGRAAQAEETCAEAPKTL